MTILLLCRHAEPGKADGVAAALAHLTLAAVYTSPLPRALETARAIAAAHGRAPVEVDALREIDRGQVENVPFDDFPAELQRGLLEEPLRVRFPGGETYEELRARVLPELERIVAAHAGEMVAVVSHAGAIRAALATWLAIADEAFFRIDQRFGAVNVVEWTDGTPLVRLINGRRP